MPVSSLEVVILALVCVGLWNWMGKPRNRVRCSYCGGVAEHHGHCPYKILDG